MRNLNIERKAAYVKKVCMGELWREAAEKAGEAEPGVQGVPGSRQDGAGVHWHHCKHDRKRGLPGVGSPDQSRGNTEKGRQGLQRLDE